MNNKKYNTCVALVCFYHASKGGHGAAEVTLSLLESLKKKKKLFEINKQIFFNFFDKYKINYFESVYKLFYLIPLYLKVKKFFFQSKKKIVIIEGASWIGYSYIFIKIIKLFSKDIIIIYHAHNIEYLLRKNKKSNFFILILTKIFEKKVYNLVNYGTAVSNVDRIKLKKLYNINALIFNNGINKRRLKYEKFNKKFPKHFLIYPGSYSFFPNKIAIDKLIYKIFPVILKKYPKFKLIITGNDFPLNKFKMYNFINYYKNIKRAELNYLIHNSKFLLAPMSKGPGTKLKIIEALMLGCIIISSKESMNGIEIDKKTPPFIFLNQKKMHEIIDYVVKNNKKIKKISNKNKISFKKKYLMENILKNFSKENKIYL